MFDSPFRIGRHNWVILSLAKRGKHWRLGFCKNVHTIVEVRKYDEYFIALEQTYFETKEEATSVLEQLIYLIENKIL